MLWIVFQYPHRRSVQHTSHPTSTSGLLCRSTTCDISRNGWDQHHIQVLVTHLRWEVLKCEGGDQCWPHRREIWSQNIRLNVVCQSIVYYVSQQIERRTMIDLTVKMTMQYEWDRRSNEGEISIGDSVLTPQYHACLVFQLFFRVWRSCVFTKNFQK